MTEWKTQIEPVDQPIVQRTLEEAQLIRPMRRVAYPRLTIRDDFDDDGGQMISLRNHLFTIGRSEGDLVFPAESLMSARHCQFRLNQQPSNQYCWLVEDLNSRHGTYLRCTEIELTPGMELLAGGTRFRLHGKTSPAKYLPNIHINHYRAPTESIRSSDELEISSYSITHDSNFLKLNQKKLELGRLTHSALGGDPFLEPFHLTIERISTESWRVVDKNSLNGVWVRITAAHLLNTNQITAGEQRFKFELPYFH